MTHRKNSFLQNSEQEILSTLLEAYKLFEEFASEKFFNQFNKDKSPLKEIIEQDLLTFSETYNDNNYFDKDNLELFLKDTIILFMVRIIFIKTLNELKFIEKQNKLDFFTTSLEYIGPIETEKIVRNQILDFNTSLFSRLESELFKDHRENENVLKAIDLLYELPPHQINIYTIGEFYQSVLSVDKRKKTGEFYTPDSIVKYIIEQTILKDKVPKGYILDPSCGIGTFIIQVLKELLSNTKKTETNLEDVYNYIVGFDLNPLASLITRFQLTCLILRQTEPNIIPPKWSPKIFSLDALLKGDNANNNWSVYRDDKTYQYIIGNPPYIRAERLKNGDKIKEDWNEIWGQNCDTSVLFIYRAIKEWLNKDGKFGFVLSGGIANSNSSSKIRKLFQKEFTITQIIWLEFSPKVWEANAIPMIVIGEKRPPSHDDIIKIAVPSKWPEEDLEFQEISYRDYFDPKVNPEGYLLPFLKHSDIKILKKFSEYKRLGNQIKFKYGIQRGNKAKLLDSPIGTRPIKVIDGKSISIGWHGEHVGWVDINETQKSSLWKNYNPEENQLQLDIFNQSMEQQEVTLENGYIIIPGIILAPTATYISNNSLAALDTSIVGTHSSSRFLKAITAFINSGICRYLCLIQLRAGIMEGSHRLHMYPRVLEKLPWPETLDNKFISNLSILYENLEKEANKIKNKKALPDSFNSILKVMDKTIGEIFNLTTDEILNIEKRLNEDPLNKLLPRYPWKEVNLSRPNGYKGDRYSKNKEDIKMQEKNNSREKLSPLSGCITAETEGDSLFLNTHPYHTKLPPSIISKHINYYTNLGDIVLDPFCGSGMTGVSATKLKRNVILNDLSPAATHIASGYLRFVKSKEIKQAKERVLNKFSELPIDLYQTNCSRCNGSATIAYSIWSDIVVCPSCETELNLWNCSVDPESGKVKKQFNCPNCNGSFQRKDVSARKINSIPVITVYDCDNGCSPRRHEHPTTTQELSKIKKYQTLELPSNVPNIPMMNVPAGKRWGEQYRVGYHKDVTHMHNFFTSRNIIALSKLYEIIMEESDSSIRQKLLFTFTGSLFAVSKMVKYIPSRGGRSNVPGTLYIPALNLEQNVFSVFSRRLDKVVKACEWRESIGENVIQKIFTGSANDLESIEDTSVDYIFTDPPFGENIQYAELNFIYESWINHFTNTDEEIVINKHRNQNAERYFNLLSESLKEMYRVLKPNKYASLVFNNTDPNIWRALQEAILSSGFELRGVAMLDKGKGGWNQVISSDGTARYDVILQLFKGEKLNYQKYIDLPYSDEEKLLNHIKAYIESLPPEICKERTTAYIHSIVVQYLMMHRSDMSPPKPAKLEEILYCRFKKHDGYWFI